MSVNNIYQYSVLSALLYGICQQGSTVQTILSKGDHGLGTVSGLNGELVIIDGEAYHFPSNGKLRKVHGSDIVPFTMVTRFQPTFTKTLPSLTFGLLQQELSPLLPSKQNCFLSVRIEALFQHIVCRVIACQTVPHESLGELAKRQHMHNMDNMQGTLFGFWSPAFSGGFSVPGFHLHFLSEDRSQGGHVIGFEAQNIQLEAAVIGEYQIELPGHEEFNQDVIANVAEEELKKAQGA